MLYVNIYMHIVFNRNIHTHVYKPMQTHVYKDDIHMFMRTHTCIHLFIRAHVPLPKHRRQVVEAGAHLSLGQGVWAKAVSEKKTAPTGKIDYQEKCQGIFPSPLGVPLLCFAPGPMLHPLPWGGASHGQLNHRPGWTAPGAGPLARCFVLLWFSESCVIKNPWVHWGYLVQ